MELLIDNVYTTVVNPSPKLNSELKRILSARPDGFQFMPKYKFGYWDGYVSMYADRRFPTGLLHHVLNALDKNDIAVDIIDHRDVMPLLDYNIPGYNFRPYQQEAITTALEYGNCVLKMATAAGKTLVAAAIIKATGNNAVVVVPSKALLLQTSQDLEDMLGMEIGRFGAGYKEFRNVTVTITNSLRNYLRNDLTNITTLIVDECHHTKSAQVFDNIFNIPARIRIGMSGTPLTYKILADMKLMAATGNVVYEITNEELIAMEYSAKPVIQFIYISQPDGYEIEDYQQAYKICIVRNDHRNRKIAELALEKQCGPMLIMVDWVEHLEEIHKFIGFAENVMTATGSDSKSHIEEILHNLKDSNNVLLCTSIFSEGVNIPSISKIVMASGGLSHIKLLQRIGRGLRISEGKERLIVYDFLDNTNDYLLKHSEERYKLYKSEGFEVKLL